MKFQVQTYLNLAWQWLSSLLPGSISQGRIGLYLGHDRLNVMQMGQTKGQTSIKAINSIYFQDSHDFFYQNPDKFKKLLKKAFRSKSFKGKKVVSCLPSHKIKLVTISYNLKDGQKEEEVIVEKLRERLNDELDEMVVDYRPLRQENVTPNQSESLVAFAPRKDVIAYLKLLESAGLEVDALDTGPAALARLVTHSQTLDTSEPLARPNVLLANIGAEDSYISIIWGRRLMLDRAVEFSEKRILTKLKQVLKMPEDLAKYLLYAQDTTSGKLIESKKMVTEIIRPELALLLEEFNKTLVYMASRTRGKSVDKILLIGQIAQSPGVLSYLREQLQIPVDVLDPTEIFSLNRHYKESQEWNASAGIALTAGLALRDMSES